MSTPVTCAKPVIPGRTENTPSALRAIINSCWLVRHGRGPTKDISPTKTFQICGSSSSLSLRKTRPTEVIIALSASCEGTSGAARLIVLSLISLNVFSFLPILDCLNNAGPVESIRIIIIKGMIATRATGVAIKAKKMSVKRFTIYRFPIWYDNCTPNGLRDFGNRPKHGANLSDAISGLTTLFIMGIK